MSNQSYVSEHLEATLAREVLDERYVAQVIHFMFEPDLPVYAPKSRTWYTFSGHKWKVFDGKNVLSTHINSLMSLMNSLVKAELSRCDELEARDAKITKLQKAIHYLQRNSFRQNVSRCIEARLSDPTFEEKLDRNNNLFVCENGVLDLEQGVFRAGSPNDYCSKSSGVHYVQYESSDGALIYLNSKLRQIFPNQRDLDLFLDTVALGLHGNKTRSKPALWLGRKGNNAKSTCARLVTFTFGDYCVHLDQRFSSYPSYPVMKTLINTSRIACIREGNGDATISPADLNALDGRPFIVQMYKLPSDTSQMHIVRFESVFDNNAPIDTKKQLEDNHFPEDLTFVENICNLKQTFLYILFERYKQSKEKGFEIK